jgi:hypothetical protein
VSWAPPPLAGSRRLFHGWPRRKPALRSILITACGLVALFTPLLLWLAWSTTAFWLVIAAGCAAILMIYVLIASAPDGRL